jgi:plasmid maintenance system antidote protein VapI
MSIFATNKETRPYPLDKERHERCMAILAQYGMTVTELALHMGTQKSYISELMAGRRLSVKNENRIALFFGVPREVLFPTRSMEDLTAMRIAETAEKERAEKAKAERMEARRLAMEAAKDVA